MNQFPAVCASACALARISASAILAGMAMIALAPIPATAQWVDGGIPINVAQGGKLGVKIAPDGLGGAFITWTLFDASWTGNPDIIAQHLRSDGSVDPRWPDEGLAVCTAAEAQFPAGIVPDGQGGAFIAWNDYRDAPPGSSLLAAGYVQRVTADGAIAVGWPANGMPVCTSARSEYSPRLIPDGVGGVFVACPRDTLILPGYRGPGGFLGARIGGDGILAPGWPAEGIPIAASPTRQRLGSILSDQTGGMYAISDGDVGHSYCHRIGPNGDPAPGWQFGGLEVSPVSSTGATAAPDGTGGVYFFWSTLTYDGDPSAGVYCLRVLPDGSLADGWPASGLRLRSAQAIQPLASMATSDGGAIVLSAHSEPGGVSAYAQKLTSSGSIAPGWPVDGALLGHSEEYLQNLHAASDGLGGIYAVWESYAPSPPDAPLALSVVAQHLTTDGVRAPGWPSAGIDFSASMSQDYEPDLIPVPGGAAIVAWGSYAGPPGNRIMAHKLIESGMESFALLSTQVDAAPNRVRLAWRASPPADVLIRLDRREEGGAWQAQRSARPDFTGIVRFEDSDVRAGGSYSYRVSVSPGGVEHIYGETSVRVPTIMLAMRLTSPNPSSGEITAEVELPSSAKASIELIDVRGRIVERKQLGGGGPAVLQIPIAKGKRLASGIYFLRLTQAGKAITRRAVIVQ